MEKVCSKNRHPASAPRRAIRAETARGPANRAGKLAVIGYRCVCDRCGQMLASGWRRGGTPPLSGRTKPPQKLLRPLSDSARLGFSGHRSYRASLWKARFGGFSFSRASGFLQLLPQERPRIVPGQTSLPEYFSHGKLHATCKCFFQSYTTMTKESRGTSTALC